MLDRSLFSGIQVEQNSLRTSSWLLKALLEVRIYFMVGLKVGHLFQIVPFSCS